MKYGLPFLYKPFPLADALQLSEMDQPLGGEFHFRNCLPLRSISQLSNPLNSTLITIPYFPDHPCEYEMNNILVNYLFSTDWENPVFKEELEECLKPKKTIETVPLPDSTYVTVALHVRRGGAFESYEKLARQFPLKFPPDSYYISQIRRVADLYKDRPLFVYIFTDDLNPEKIAESYAAQIQDPSVLFFWRDPSIETDPEEQLLSDFYSMGKFDCLIRSMSNFSIMASKLGNYSLMISPVHGSYQDGQLVIDQVETLYGSE